MGTMKSVQTRSRRVVGWNSLLPPLLFGVAALILRLWQLDGKSVWLDEAFTAWHSTFSALDLWTRPIADKPPLYYLITSLFWSPGDGSFGLRLPAALLGAFSVSLSWFLGRLLGGVRVAFLLALLMLIADINIAYSQEARQYMLLTVGWLLLVIALLRMIRASAEQPRPRAADLLLFGIGVIIMVHTHPIALQYVAATAMAYAGALFIGGGARRAFFIAPLLLGLLAGITILPWIPMALGKAGQSFHWLQQPHPAQALLEFMSLFGGKHLALAGGRYLAMTAGLVLVIVSVAGIAHYLLRRDRAAGVFVAGLLVLPPLLIWVSGYVRPVYMLRTITPSHVLAMTGLALALDALPRRRWRIMAASVLVAVLAASSWFYFADYKKEAWRGLTRQLQSRMAPGDMVLICEKYLQTPLWFYLNDDMPPLLHVNARRHRARVRLPGDGPWLSFRKAMSAGPPATVWVVNRYAHCPRNIGAILRAVTGRDYWPQTPWRGQALSLTPFRLPGAGLS